jgi:hypothetical protein
MTDEQIKYMVDRFLSWKFPEDFDPDGGISFKKISNEGTHWPYKNHPTGTNLLTADQARQMILFMISGMPESLTYSHYILQVNVARASSPDPIWVGITDGVDHEWTFSFVEDARKAMIGEDRGSNIRLCGVTPNGKVHVIN